MTEPKVVRYAFYGDDGEANPVENPGGGWVDYDDYKALAARVEELEGELRATNDILTDRNNELFTARQENTRLREALDQYREDADEWECQTCGEWQREWQMYCDKPECRAALKEKP